MNNKDKRRASRASIHDITTTSVNGADLHARQGQGQALPGPPQHGMPPLLQPQGPGQVPLGSHPAMPHTMQSMTMLPGLPMIHGLPMQQHPGLLTIPGLPMPPPPHLQQMQM